MKVFNAVLAVALLPLVVACNDSGSGSKIENGGTGGGHQQGDNLLTRWKATELVSLGSSGLLQANLKTTLEGETLHLFYYDVNAQDSNRYDVKYLSYDLALKQVLTSPETVATLDNSSSLSAALGPTGPQVAYRGGSIRECNGSQQSDTMISKRLPTWQEETAAIGFVDRASGTALEDGLAGGAMSLVVDANGNRHMAFQYFYEGCDLNPFTYPDLHYVTLLSGVDYSNRANAPVEEQVDGNVLSTDDGANYNKLVGTGNVNELLLDANNNPLVVYSAEEPLFGDHKIGLKIARRENNSWLSEWILDDCIVEGVDAAYDRTGELGIAAYTTQCGDDANDPRLHFIKNNNGVWVKQTITMTARAGQYPSLAFDQSNRPMIAFYELSSYQNRPLKNLKVARLESNGWQISPVSNLDDVGKYNQLQVLDDGQIALVSYVASKNKIVLFQPE